VDLESPKKQPQTANSRFTIYALAISESREKQPNALAVIAGRYNKLSLWDWFNGQIYELEYFSSDGKKIKSFLQSQVKINTLIV
jgi:hypothetical protein